MSWLKRSKEPKAEKRVKIPEGLWVKCTACKEIIYRKEFEKNLKVCPKCNYHFRIGAKERISLTFDSGSFIESDFSLTASDPLEFIDRISYKERIKRSQGKSKLKEAVLTGEATINNKPVIIAVMDFSFMGGSMGSVVGEKIARAIERTIEKDVSIVVFSSSGGARMQEGILSLMQMAKVSAVIGKLKEKAIPYISVLTDPTFGGVSASFAMLGDIIIAEPKSLIGFAGARVIKLTINQELPKNFQRAEFLLEHGLIDMIVTRKEMKETIAKLIKVLRKE